MSRQIFQASLRLSRCPIAWRATDKRTTAPFIYTLIPSISTAAKWYAASLCPTTRARWFLRSAWNPVHHDFQQLRAGSATRSVTRLQGLLAHGFFALGNYENAIHRRQHDFLLCPAGPVNFNLVCLRDR